MKETKWQKKRFHHRFTHKDDPKRPYYTRPGRNPKTRDNYKLGANICPTCGCVHKDYECPKCKEKEIVNVC